MCPRVTRKIDRHEQGASLCVHVVPTVISRSRRSEERGLENALRSIFLSFEPIFRTLDLSRLKNAHTNRAMRSVLWMNEDGAKRGRKATRCGAQDQSQPVVLVLGDRHRMFAGLVVLRSSAARGQGHSFPRHRHGAESGE